MINTGEEDERHLETYEVRCLESGLGNQIWKRKRTEAHPLICCQSWLWYWNNFFAVVLFVLLQSSQNRNKVASAVISYRVTPDLLLPLEDLADNVNYSNRETMKKTRASTSIRNSSWVQKCFGCDNNYMHTLRVPPLFPFLSRSQNNINTLGRENMGDKSGRHTLVIKRQRWCSPTVPLQRPRQHPLCLFDPPPMFLTSWVSFRMSDPGHQDGITLLESCSLRF